MNTGGPASKKTLLDEFAGQALAGFFGFISETQAAMKDAGLPGIKREQVAKECYDQASAMLAEKARREATGKDSLTVQTREVDDDRWAKFQDGFRISFQPTIGWCAEIRDGSMGYGNTIAEAIANLRARWEERSAAPVVQQSSTTQDAAKVAELQAANRELVEALDSLEVWGDELSANVNPPGRNCSCHISPPCNDCVDFTGQREAKHGWEDAKNKARAILAKHKGAA